MRHLASDSGHLAEAFNNKALIRLRGIIVPAEVVEERNTSRTVSKVSGHCCCLSKMISKNCLLGPAPETFLIDSSLPGSRESKPAPAKRGLIGRGAPVAALKGIHGKVLAGPLVLDTQPASLSSPASLISPLLTA